MESIDNRPESSEQQWEISLSTRLAKKKVKDISTKFGLKLEILDNPPEGYVDIDDGEYWIHWTGSERSLKRAVMWWAIYCCGDPQAEFEWTWTSSAAPIK